MDIETLFQNSLLRFGIYIKSIIDLYTELSN
jgi:hypothetical protein